jgi:hypothetical protein
MPPVATVEQCRLDFEKYFEGNLKETGSPDQAADFCAHNYLDGKPLKKGYTHIVRATALWQCSFWQRRTENSYSSESISLALGRSLHSGLTDEKLFKRLLKTEPEILKRGIRYSQIFLQPESPPWKAILTIVDGAHLDFLQFVKVCQLLYEELQQHEIQIFDLQKQLNDLTIFEYLLYGSLFTFQNLVPDEFCLPKADENWNTLHQSAWDALGELLIWKLRGRSENDLRLNERFLAKSLKQHLMPLLLPGEMQPSRCLEKLNQLAKLVALVVEKNDFLHGTIYEFCYDDDYRYRFDGDHITIYPIDIPAESDWDFNGRKFSALHKYWFNRAIIEYCQSNLLNQKFGLPENNEFNRLAYIKACQVYLQLDEVFGLEPEISLSDGTQVDLFKAIHSLELMTAFFNVSYIAKFQEHLKETGNWIAALSLLMLEGIATGENRFPLTWAEPSEKAERIKSWTISEMYPEGDIKVAKAILEFWTNDLKVLKDNLTRIPNIPTPEFNEQPIIKLGLYGFQLPWLIASQNNSTAAINNLRRIGSRRKDRTDETHRIESRLGDLFRSRGFAVIQAYQPEVMNGYDPGEVDLICYQDNYLLILEIKSTYIRKTKKEAWIHRTTTLRKAALQLKRKKIAVQNAIAVDVTMQSELKLPSDIRNIQVHSWIVDTSIEYDQASIDDILKVSLEGLIVILRNERHLLGSNLQFEKDIAQDNLFTDGFKTQTFVKIVENGDIWKMFQQGNMNGKLHIKENSSLWNLQE